MSLPSHDPGKSHPSGCSEAAPTTVRSPQEGTAAVPAAFTFDLAALSDVGSERSNNEDACGSHVESSVHALVVVADGVGGYEGGELASRTAVDVTLATYRDSPVAWGAPKRLYRAVQQANIEIYDRAIVVPELRHMATTIVAAAVDRGVLYAAHVGDSRLYLIRDGRIRQLTKDHTIVAERARLGLIGRERAREHPERSTLTRSVGPELIVAIDKLTTTLVQGDTLVLCTDGLYNVLGDEQLQSLVGDLGAEAACRALIDAANARGTIDNITAGVFRMTGTTPPLENVGGLRGRLRKLFGSSRR